MGDVDALCNVVQSEVSFCSAIYVLPAIAMLASLSLYTVYSL